MDETIAQNYMQTLSRAPLPNDLDELRILSLDLRTQRAKGIVLDVWADVRRSWAAEVLLHHREKRQVTLALTLTPIECL